MKTFRIIICCALLFLAAPQPGYCQFGRIAKKVTQMFTGKAAKEAAEEAAEKSTKAVGKKVAKEAGKGIARKAIGKNVSKSLVKESTEKVIIKDAANVSKFGLEKALRNDIAKAAAKKGEHFVAAKSTKAMGRSFAEIAEKAGLKRFGAKESGELFERTARYGVKREGQKVARNIEANAVQKASQEAVDKAGKQTAAKVAEKKIRANAAKKITANDKYNVLRELDKKVKSKKQYDALSPETQSQLDQFRKLRYGKNGGYKKIPKSGGTWTGEPGNSKFIPDPKLKPKNKGYSNLQDKTWGDICKEYGVDGIPYKNGEIDLEPFAKMKTTMNFDTGISEKAKQGLLKSKPNREQLHEEFYTKLAKEHNCTVQEIKAIKENNNLVVHECADCQTLLLVPRELHDNLTHSGGVEMYRMLCVTH